MYRECFEGREAFTVGETSFATPVSAPLYSDKERKELTMVFGFEHLGLEEVKGNGKWDLKPLDVNELKQVFLVWQKALHEKDGTACSGLIMTSPELFPVWAMTRFTGRKVQNAGNDPSWNAGNALYLSGRGNRNDQCKVRFGGI